MTRHALFIAYLLSTLTTFGQISNKGKDYALFFAINDYSDRSWPDLRNPIKDVETIAGILERYYNFEATIYRNSSLREIERTLIDWKKRAFAEDTQLFVFFSGHGFFNEDFKKGYFVPQDGIGENFRTFFDFSDIGNLVTQIPCKHILLAIDACYSGTIDQEIAFKGKPNKKISANAKREAFIRRQLAFKSRLLITSGGKERTLDDSQFADAILSGLRETYTNTEGDGLFSFQDLLAKLSRVDPKPHFDKLIGDEDGGFVFIGQTFPKNEQNNPFDHRVPTFYDPTNRSEQEQYFYHVVNRGETMSSIAFEYGHTEKVFRQMNGYSPTQFPKIGSKLIVRIRRYHIVRDGETIYSIGRKYSLPVEKIRELNNLEKNEVVIPFQKVYIE